MRTPASSSSSLAAGVHITLTDLLRLRGEASGFSFLPRQPVTSLLAGRHASRLRGRGLAFEELRHYQQGDDIRTMDWRATARLRSPQVRVYAEERERPVLLVVDQRQTMFFGSRRAMKSVTAAELAALAAWRALAAGDRVGGIVFGDHEMIDLPPHRSQTRVLRLLHEVVRFNQALAGGESSGDTGISGDMTRTGGLLRDRVPGNLAGHAPGTPVSLNQALEAALRRAKHDHLVVVISDFTGADATTQRLATLLAAHNDMLAVAVYDPLGASLQGYPGMMATDRGVTHALPLGEAFAASFSQAFADRLQQWMAIFRALRVPVIPVSAALSPVEQLRDLFGAHLRRRPEQP
jgi:uncharacterized protein (DUF58 family)